MKWILILALLTAANSNALVTAYVKFDHPEGWRCELVEGVFVCQSMLEPDRHESLVLSIAALATEWDTLENYESFLKNPKPQNAEDGKPLVPKVTYVRRREIHGQSWIDSLQLNSELPGFYSRYLATISKGAGKKLAILITYIVSEQRYQALAPVFERMIGTLKINDEFDLNTPSNQPETGIENNANLPLGSQGKGKILDKLRKKEPIFQESAKEQWSFEIKMTMVGAIVILLLVYLKSKRKKSKKKSGRKVDPKM